MVGVISALVRYVYRVPGDPPGVLVFGLTLRASAPENVREERKSRTFSVDTRVSSSSLIFAGDEESGRWCAGS
jgi:hypothetical protein